MANKASTATAFSLRLRLHYKAARVGGVKKDGLCFDIHKGNFVSPY